MRFAINLRRDLAKLDDDELAQRLDGEWQKLAIARSELATMGSSAPVNDFFVGIRGPIRHASAYRLATHLGLTGTVFDFAAAFGLNGRGLPSGREHISLCEIQDIIDEMKRRVRHAKRNAQS